MSRYKGGRTQGRGYVFPKRTKRQRETETDFDRVVTRLWLGRNQKWSSIERIAENRFQAQFAPIAPFRPGKQIGSGDSIILSIFLAFPARPDIQ